MSPSDLARILPFSKATIQRKLHELVHVDGELVSVFELDGREPARYGFWGEAKLTQDVDIVKPKPSENPNKTSEPSPHIQLSNMEGSNPNMPGSKPNTEGSNPNDYTTLENPLKRPLERQFESPLPLLRRGNGSETLSPDDSGSLTSERSRNTSCGAIDDLPVNPVQINWVSSSASGQGVAVSSAPSLIA